MAKEKIDLRKELRSYKYEFDLLQKFLVQNKKTKNIKNF